MRYEIEVVKELQMHEISLPQQITGFYTCNTTLYVVNSPGNFPIFVSSPYQSIAKPLLSTLRDNFASRAMQGIVVNSGRNGFKPEDHEKIVNFAYRLADAMLKAREAV